MPLADEAGPPVDDEGALALDDQAASTGSRDLPMDGAALDGGLSGDRLASGTDAGSADALAGRTDLDPYGGDPDARFPGAEDPTMTSSLADASMTSGADDLDDAGDVDDTRR